MISLSHKPHRVVPRFRGLTAYTGHWDGAWRIPVDKAGERGEVDVDKRYTPRIEIGDCAIVEDRDRMRDDDAIALVEVAAIASDGRTLTCRVRCGACRACEAWVRPTRRAR